MSRIWGYLASWVAALVVVAFLIPIIAPPESLKRASAVTVLLIALQLFGLGVAIYSGVLAWKSRKSPRLMVVYAAPPLIILLGFVALFPLIALATAVER